MTTPAGVAGADESAAQDRSSTSAASATSDSSAGRSDSRSDNRDRPGRTRTAGRESAAGDDSDSAEAADPDENTKVDAEAEPDSVVAEPDDDADVEPDDDADVEPDDIDQIERDTDSRRHVSAARPRPTPSPAVATADDSRSNTRIDLVTSEDHDAVTSEETPHDTEESAVPVEAVAATTIAPDSATDAATSSPVVKQQEPLTWQSVVTDVWRWFGLGTAPEVPPARIGPVLEGVWLGLRRVQYTLFNQRPVATATTPEVDPLTGTYVGDIGMSDSDGDVVIPVLGTTPSRGEVTIDADGSYVYTPDVDFAVTGGTDSFTVHLDDVTANEWHLRGFLEGLGIGKPTVVTVTVQVAANQAPTVDFNVGVPAGDDDRVPINIVVTDPDGDSVEQRGVGLISADASKGIVEFDPDLNVYFFYPTVEARTAAYWAGEGAPETFATVRVTVADEHGEQTVQDITVPVAQRYVLVIPDGGTGVVYPDENILVNSVIRVDADGIPAMRTIDEGTGSVIFLDVLEPVEIWSYGRIQALLSPENRLIEIYSYDELIHMFEMLAQAEYFVGSDSNDGAEVLYERTRTGLLTELFRATL
ncbi:Ig-like domain-containing protein [Mycobacterium sp. NAZ190054]|uniref:Ig-like domain-containing protein n=1 Tax=Mycobacterium sp. NAZ190054 TaxID=1747766 RepID=UPI0012E3A144|nr:Ig-like domain-containing protein [Mycobacterium sp. NAZ190054]